MRVTAPTAEQARSAAAAPTQASSAGGDVRLALALVGAHLRGRRGHGSGRASLAMAVVGMGAGVMMLTSVLGIMNGLQLGYIEDLVEIGSFHLRISRAGHAAISPVIVEDLEGQASVRTVTPLADLATLIGRPPSDVRHPMTLRAVPADVAAREPSFAEELGLGAAPLDLGTVTLGAAAAARLGVGVGDAVTVYLIDTAVGGRPVPHAARLVVAGTFESGFTQFDLHWALTSLATAEMVTGGGLPLEYGIKLANRFRDATARAAVGAILAEEYRDYEVRTWREFNQAFYGALRTEKLLMSMLIALVFVVVGFNVFHGMRRRIQERRQEIGVLRALGATPVMLRLAYSVEATAGGVVGVVCGLAVGLAIADNLTALLTLTQSVMNALLEVAARFAPQPSLRPRFSGSTFFLEEIPNRVLLHEAVLTCAVAIGAGLAAALAAGRWLRGITPERIMREARE
jgi:lipoprotein-releasing system permease protein